MLGIGLMINSEYVNRFALWLLWVVNNINAMGREWATKSFESQNLRFERLF